MEQIIAPALFFRKSCTLPGIGTLSVVQNPAETDFVNTQILAPYPTIHFSPDKNEKTFNEFSAISKLIIQDLEQKGEAVLSGIGTFTKAAEDTLIFSPIAPDASFTPAVSAKRVIRQDAEHAILVGDKETSNVVMTEFFNETNAVKDYWWIWAIALGVIGAGLLIYYFTLYGCNNLGNVHSYIGM